MLGFRKLERIVKGFSNHRRIEIMDLISDGTEPCVMEISQKLKINMKTASEHIRRLTIAGLVLKRNQGTNVRHKLSPLGIIVLKFLRRLE